MENKKDVTQAVNELKEIEDRVNELLAIAPGKVRGKVVAGDVAGDVAGAQAGAIAEKTDSIDTLAVSIVDLYETGEISAIAGAIADKKIKVLQTAKLPKDRQTILTGLGVTNHRKNYERFMLA
jgi:hypothetical protein